MRKLLIAAAGAAMLLPSCDVKDPIYNTTHPEHGQVIVSADWSAIGTGISAPSAYTVLVDDRTYAVTSDPYTIPDLIDPGERTFYFHNTAVGITMNGTVASVAAANGNIVNMPDWFFTAAVAETVQKDAVQEFTAPMAQQVRELTIEIVPTGDAAALVESIVCTLSGVAGTFDLNGGVHGTPSTVALVFEKSAEGNSWTATVRLLGVIPDGEKILSGMVTYTGGNPEDMDFSSDLTSALANFNADKATPLRLSGQMVETPTEAVVSGTTINDWVVVTGVDIVVN